MNSAIMAGILFMIKMQRDTVFWKPSYLYRAIPYTWQDGIFVIWTPNISKIIRLQKPRVMETLVIYIQIYCQNKTYVTNGQNYPTTVLYCGEAIVVIKYVRIQNKFTNRTFHYQNNVKSIFNNKNFPYNGWGFHRTIKEHVIRLSFPHGWIYDWQSLFSLFGPQGMIQYKDVILPV